MKVFYLNRFGCSFLLSFKFNEEEGVIFHKSPEVSILIGFFNTKNDTFLDNFISVL